MDEAPNTANNPAGEPPSAADGNTLEADILATFELDDTAAEADRIAEGAASTDPQPAPATEGGDGVAAPSPSPQPSPAPASLEPTPAAPTPAKEKPPGEPSPAPASPETPAAAAKPPEAEAGLREASLKAQVDALERVVADLRANPAAAPAAPAESGKPSEETTETPPFRYNLTLPKPIVDAISSGEPEEVVKGISNIVNDLGTIVHNTVLTQVRSEVKEALTWMSQQAAAGATADTTTADRETKRQAYFGKFAAHNNALVLPIIQNEAQKMAAEFPSLPWSDDYINALGARVNATIEAISSKKPPEETPSGEQPAPKPAAMLPTGPRGDGAATPSGDISAEIEGVLDPFG